MADPGEGNPADTVSFPGMSGEYTGMMAARRSAPIGPNSEPTRQQAGRCGKVALADRTLAQLAEATAEVGQLRDRLDDLGGKLDGAQAELAAAQDQVEALTQAEAERRARGLLARLSAALQGE